MSDLINPFDNVFQPAANAQPQVEIPPPEASFAQVGGNTQSPNQQIQAPVQQDINPFGQSNSPLQPTIAPTVVHPQEENPFGSPTPQTPINNMAFNQQPQNFNQQPPSQQNWNNNNNQQAKKVYNITDLYWLQNINPNKTANEFDALTIGYNLDYDNIRLTFFGANGMQVSDTQLNLNYQNRAGSANIYPEVAQELLYKLKHPANTQQQIAIIERSLSSTSNWKPAKSAITIYNPEAIGLFTVINNQPIMFPLLGWQVNCLISAIEFAINQASTAKFITKAGIQTTA